ncbi:MAG TPA: hypothetical protein VLH09_06230, partial [Bryobacteraceae bacterium]|nr:hypothetical protein [Bryobacteraceae bacterium]
MRKHSAFYQQFAPAMTPEQKLSANLLTMAEEHGYTELPFVERAAKTAEVATKVGLRLGSELINST